MTVSTQESAVYCRVQRLQKFRDCDGGASCGQWAGRSWKATFPTNPDKSCYMTLTNLNCAPAQFSIVSACQVLGILVLQWLFQVHLKDLYQFYWLQLEVSPCHHFIWAPWQTIKHTSRISPSLFHPALIIQPINPQSELNKFWMPVWGLASSTISHLLGYLDYVTKHASLKWPLNHLAAGFKVLSSLPEEHTLTHYLYSYYSSPMPIGPPCRIQVVTQTPLSQARILPSLSCKARSMPVLFRTMIMTTLEIL